MINETAQTVLEITKADIYNPIVITTWVMVLLIFGLVTWINSWGHKTKWTNFWRIWLPTVVVSGIVVTIFVMSPTVISEIINWIKEFLGV